MDCPMLSNFGSMGLSDDSALPQTRCGVRKHLGTFCLWSLFFKSPPKLQRSKATSGACPVSGKEVATKLQIKSTCKLRTRAALLVFPLHAVGITLAMANIGEKVSVCTFF